MTTFMKASALLVAGVIAGCRPAAQSNADTVAATTSTIPAVSAGPSDSVSVGTSTPTGTTAAASGTKKTKVGSASTKTSASTRRTSNAAADSGILGRDSVIRFPRRWPGQASSTPVRK
jgi:hypothetical protein